MDQLYKMHKINPQGTFPLRIFLSFFGAVFDLNIRSAERMFLRTCVLHTVIYHI